MATTRKFDFALLHESDIGERERCIDNRFRTAGSPAQAKQLPFGIRQLRRPRNDYFLLTVTPATHDPSPPNPDVSPLEARPTPSYLPVYFCVLPG